MWLYFVLGRSRGLRQNTVTQRDGNHTIQRLPKRSRTHQYFYAKLKSKYFSLVAVQNTNQLRHRSSGVTTFKRSKRQFTERKKNTLHERRNLSNSGRQSCHCNETVDGRDYSKTTEHYSPHTTIRLLRHSWPRVFLKWVHLYYTDRGDKQQAVFARRVRAPVQLSSTSTAWPAG